MAGGRLARTLPMAALILSVPIVHGALTRQAAMTDDGQPLAPGILPILAACGDALLLLALASAGFAVRSWLIASELVAEHTPVLEAFLQSE